MNVDTNAAGEEHFTALLIACDEALAAGLPARLITGAETPSELRPRLERGVACLHLLEQFWSKDRAADGPSGPTPLTRFGRFQILRELGHGGFGTVFLAHDPLLGREVALKVPRLPALLAPEFRQRFRHEGLAAARLDHPNVVPVYEAGEVDDICFITSPYCPGTSLAAWLQQRVEPVPWGVAAALVATLAEAVQYAHSRGVLHRDLKPANILLVEGGAAVEGGGWRVEGGREKGKGDGDPKLPETGGLAVGHGSGGGVLPADQEPSEGRTVRHHQAPLHPPPSTLHPPPSTLHPRITDFGLAKLLVEGQPDETATGMILGTPSYMAPEQAEPNKEITTAVDVYGLGAILYEMLTARPVFQADSALATLEQVRSQEPVPPRRLRAGLPRDLETICLKCLHKEPQRRYVSAHALADDLRRLLAGEPIQARAVGLGERLLKWARRRPAPAALVSVTCLAAVLLVVVYVVGNMRVARQKAATDQALQRELQTNVELTEALQRERRASYFHRITLAHHEWLDSNVVRTEELLAGCPPELRQWEWHYLKRLGQTGFVTFRGHTGEIAGVAFDPGGKRLASAGWDGTVRVWDAETGRAIHTLRGHSGRVDNVAFSRDGRLLASASHDRTVKVWDAVTGREWYTLSGHVGEVSGVAFSPDGKRLASGGWDGTVRVWDTSARRRLHTLAAPPRVFSVAFSPDGRRLVSGGEGDVRVWDPTTGQLLGTCAADQAEALIWVGCVAFSADGQRLASANGNQTVTIWDSATRKPLRILRGHKSGVYGVQFSPDGRRLASASYDQTVRLWDAASGAELHTLRGHTDSWVSAVAFSPDGRRLASAGGDKTIRVWDALGDQEALIIPGERHRQVACSPDGRFLATGGWYDDCAVAVWDAATGKPLLHLPGHSDCVWSVAFRPDSRRLASAGADGTVKIWNTTTWKVVATFRGHGQQIIKLAYSPDGSRLASASSDRTVKIWDPAAGQLIRTLEGHADQVTSVAFSPDGDCIASASEDNTVRIWNPATGHAIRTLTGHALGVTSVAFDRTGKWLVSGSRDGTVKRWNLSGDQAALTLNGHTGTVWDVVFSPDGRRVASASQDNTVKLWDAATGEEALTLRTPMGGFRSVAFSPDGSRLIGGVIGMRIWETTATARR